MTEELARAKVLEILKRNNWYAVVNFGHWGIYLYVLDLSKVDKTEKSITNEVYSTMYEQFACEYYFDNVVFDFDYSYRDRDKVSYADFLSKLEGLQKEEYDECHCGFEKS